MSALAVLALAGCHGQDSTSVLSSDPLVGSFGVKENGTVTPYLKVDKVNGKYQASDFDTATKSWTLENTDTKPVTRDELKNLIGREPDFDFQGIQIGDVVFFHVPADTPLGQFSTHTGYFALLAIQPVELQKLD